MWLYPHIPADLATFTEEILNEVFCAVKVLAINSF